MQTITDLCGNTPLIKLQNILGKDSPEICLKLERYNAAGSIKDRPAKYIIERAEQAGILKPGSTLIESSSGNFGISCAMLGAAKGYKVIIIIDPKTTPANHALLKAYGAQVIVATEKDDTGSYNKTRIKMANELLRQIPNSFMPNQFFNLENSEAHYLQTAPELYAQCDKKIDILVLNIGSGGHVGGMTRFFREHSPQTQIVIVDPIGSTMFGGTPGNYFIPAVGLSWTPHNVTHLNYLDAIYKIPDEDAFLTSRLLAKHEGVLVGGSTGASVILALKLALNQSADKRIVCIAADSGERYLDTIFNDTWMQERNLQTECSLAELNERATNLKLYTDNPEQHANYNPGLMDL